MLEKTKEISEKYAENSFHHLFWDQQLEALKVRDMRQVRWHPMMIHWCPSLKLLSSSTSGRQISLCYRVKGHSEITHILLNQNQVSIPGLMNNYVDKQI